MMITKKNILVIAVALVALFGKQATAQHAVIGSGLNTAVEQFEYKNDSLYIKIDIDLKKVKLTSKKGIIYAPIIETENQKLKLPVILLQGRNNAAVYRRTMALMSDTMKKEYIAEENMPYAIIKNFGRNAKKENARFVKYTYTVPYDPWMVESQLKLSSILYGCCDIDTLPTTNILKSNLSFNLPVIESYTVTPQLAYIKPTPVAHKRRNISSVSNLIFAVNSSILKPTAHNNKEELAKIENMLQMVKSDKDLTINSVKIIGYASPEGSLSNNKRLSENRAKSLEQYIKRKYNLKNNLYNIVFGGENWDDLTPIVQNSDMQYKEEIANIIQTVSIKSGRKSQLIKLNRGAPYRYMLKNFFPALRKVIVEVGYEVDAYDLAKIKTVILDRPGNLSLEEIYRLSETYPVGSSEFVQLFMTASTFFPEDDIAQYNAAVTSIIKEDLKAATLFIQKIGNGIESATKANVIGAYYLVSGNYKRAEIELLKAKKLGSKEADQNLVELNRKLLNIEAIDRVKQMKEKIYGK